MLSEMKEVELGTNSEKECLEFIKRIEGYSKQVLAQVKTELEPKYSAYVERQLQQFLNVVPQGDKSYNYICLLDILKYAEEFLKETIEMVSKSLKSIASESGDDKAEERVYFKKRIATFIARLLQLAEFAQNVRNVPSDDLFCQPQSSDDWQLIRTALRFFEFSSFEVGVNEYRKYGYKLYYILAAIGRTALVVPKTEAEMDYYLDRSFVENKESPTGIKYCNKPEVPESKLDSVTPKLLERVLANMVKPERGIDNGSFFIANADYRVIKILFNFQEKAWINYIREVVSFENVSTNFKHYISSSQFAEFMEDLPKDRPANLNQKKMTLNEEHLISPNLFKKPAKPDLMVRLLYHKKLNLIKKDVLNLAKESELGFTPSHSSVTKQGDATFTGLSDEEIQKIKKYEKQLKEKMYSHDDNEDLPLEMYGQSPDSLLIHQLKLESRGSALKQMKATDGQKGYIPLPKIPESKDSKLDALDLDSPGIPEEAQIQTAKYAPSTPSPSFKANKGLQFQKLDKAPQVLASTPRSDFASMKPCPDNLKPYFVSNFEIKIRDDWFDKFELEDFKTVIVHVHGGGFVAQSSASHQIYLNRWANTFRKPIFSIDYRLAPDSQFPHPINDVITGYLWVLNYLQFVIGVDVKHIIVIGDSAGGSLLTCLTAWCIINGIRKPDRMVMFYPAMSCDNSYFTPSVLLSLNDFMLSYAALKMCQEYYVGKNQDPSSNPYISPKLMPANILEQFPPIKMFLSERDPLRDDGLRFVLAALKAGVDLRLYISRNLSHGLLSLSTKSGLPDAVCFMDQVINVIQGVIDELK